ncbi:MAG TPA: hypothetical protein VFM70_12305, partial [Salinimicrobium sp.]|nr:hypothetical protein [Salinimicrobium sp.]
MNSKHFYLLFVFFFTSYSYSQVGIGTLTPAENALLEVASDSQGILIPRMTKAQRDAITVNSESEGLLIYQTDDAEGFYFYNGSTWSAINPASMVGHWSPSGDDIYNNNAQYVGIGTGTAITAPLHVKSNGGTSSETEIVELYKNDFSSGIGSTSGNGCDWILSSGEAVNNANCNPDTDQVLTEGSFAPTTTSIEISFDYSFHTGDGIDFFNAVLFNLNTNSIEATLVPDEDTDITTSFSGSITVTATNNYELRFQHKAKKNKGGYATLDNILVTEETVTVV